MTTTSTALGDDKQALSDYLKQHIRDIPDFPTPGIMFRDISTLLADPEVFRITIDAMAAPFSQIDKVVIIESRGFILGTPIAYAIGAGVVPVRKPGRLPFASLAEEYVLEYGTNTLEIHEDAITPGERILIVDDLLATGGTVEATIKLVKRLGGEIVGISVLAELTALNGRAKTGDYPLHSLVTY
ncbi:MAG TPA: adenine phosphoribosyltransferase [Thermomicrobiales bacterium]|nr:adenine phosphoribosyltransferase [Thermomicrobiales bacterium]